MFDWGLSYFNFYLFPANLIGFGYERTTKYGRTNPIEKMRENKRYFLLYPPPPPFKIYGVTN